jgi:hypothetical protein
MAHTDFMSMGRPQAERHRTLRAAAAIVAATAGAGAVLVGAFVVLGGGSTGAWIAVAAMLALSLTGVWWRWDAPDARNPHFERERRGF